MRRSYILFSLLTLLAALPVVVSCNAGPQPQDSPETPPLVDEPAPPPPGEPEPQETFDPRNVSKEMFENTKVEVQQFIGDLNQAIRNKNFNAWKDALSEEYFTKISSPDFLRQVSESDALKARRIVLQNVLDYFTNVVVPSRANSRVDDIEFISEYRVKAYTVNSKGERLRLYDLEHLYVLQQSGNSWKIVN